MRSQTFVVAVALCGIFSLASDGILAAQPAQARTTRAQDALKVARSQREGVLTASDPNAQINLRSEPSERARISGYGVVGDRVEILNEVRNRDGNWYEVRFPQSGAKGWIRGDFIRVSGGGSTSSSSQSMSLSQTGKGRFTLAGRRDQTIESASVSVDSRGNAELALRMSDRNLVRFSGRMVAKDAYALTLDLRNSGNADAEGTANIEYGANNSINRIIADGRLDGQNFSVNFTGNQNSGNNSGNNSNNTDLDFLGKNVDEVVSRLRRDGWQVTESTNSVVKLDRGQIGMDIEFNSRTRRITSVRMADLT